MNRTKWITLGSAAALLLAARPAAACGSHGHAPAQPSSGAHVHGGATSEEHGAPPAQARQVTGREVRVTVTKNGFVPAEISARRGEILNLVVTRQVDDTCVTELVQKEQGVRAALPLDQPVAVTLQVPSDGQLEFSCGHGHVTGHVVAQ
jgi:hypothetical protein